MQENDPANERRRKSAIFRNLLMLDNLPTFPARGMTLSEIHTLLEDEGFELSMRTIQRDLKMLSEWANLGYEDDDLGYRRWFRDLKKRNVLDILPTSEAFMLVLSEQLLRRVLPLHQSDKLEAWLNQANVTLSSKHLYANWMKKVRVVSDNYPIIYDEQHIDEPYRKIIYESVLNEKVISIGYQSSELSDKKYYTLNPLGLIIREQSHYLVATKEESPEVPQLFLFHKIVSVQKEYLGITKPKSFTLDEYYAKNPTGWLLEDTLTTVELKVKHYALDVVKHNKLSIDQQLEQIDETWWKVTMTCYPTYDLIGWILKFGQDVVCLSPSSLKQFVVKRLQATIENYE
ncbi:MULTISPECIES: helix-turn-helix transcriptional regulator [Shewanella]|uniref:helix-turn-helix transcriptional regulator n=1 Tax=Shewanella TaxID=22 RepID=UPI00356A1B1E